MRHSGSPRVVISGIGVVSPFGIGRDRFWEHISRG
jgi:3-oxoacyl-(acyl-carrier-protein) synthase